MRLFIAIPLPGDVRELAVNIQAGLSMDFRPVRDDPMHLTIAFLGEKPEYESIIKKLEDIRFLSFILKTRGFGFFPSENKIRVVWLGLEENMDFQRLQHQIREKFDFREKLMPHITVARAKELIMDRENHWKKKLSSIGYEEQEFLVDKFVLYESVPTPQGY